MPFLGAKRPFLFIIVFDLMKKEEKNLLSFPIFQMKTLRLRFNMGFA